MKGLRTRFAPPPTLRRRVPTWRSLLPLLLVGGLPLGGCAAGIAAGALGAAVNASRPAETTQDLRQPAIAACTARAGQHGEVRIIDADQRSGGRVTVWGTVQDPQQRRAFECGWNGEVRGFKLREIPAR